MRRILVVPNTLRSELEAVLLGREMFELRAAETIEDAILMTASWPPELIIFSEDLVDGSPAELCARVRQDRRLEGTRLLLLSSFLPGDDVGAEVLLAEVDAHLIQPVAEEPLLRTVGVLLDIQLERTPPLPLEILAQVKLEARADRSDPRHASNSMLANVLVLSETGLKLECQDRLKPGEVIRVIFSLPASSDAQASSDARATRVESRCMVLNADALQLHYGCQFLDCGPEEKNAISQFVRERLAAAEAQS